MSAGRALALELEPSQVKTPAWTLRPWVGPVTPLTLLLHPVRGYRCRQAAFEESLAGG